MLKVDWEWSHTLRFGGGPIEGNHAKIRLSLASEMFPRKYSQALVVPSGVFSRYYYISGRQGGISSRFIGSENVVVDVSGGDGI